MEDVFIQYRDEVKKEIYPGPEHTVYMSDEEALKFAQKMKWDSKLEELDKKASKASRKKVAKKVSLPSKKKASKKKASAKKKTKKKASRR